MTRISIIADTGHASNVAILSKITSSKPGTGSGQHFQRQEARTIIKARQVAFEAERKPPRSGFSIANRIKFDLRFTDL